MIAERVWDCESAQLQGAAAAGMMSEISRFGCSLITKLWGRPRGSFNLTVALKVFLQKLR